MFRRSAHGGSVEADPRSLGAVQQAFEVEAGELVVRAFADLRREGRKRAGVAGFQLGERLRDSSPSKDRSYCSGGKRLERAQRLGPAAQHEVADRPAAEIRRPVQPRSR